MNFRYAILIRVIFYVLFLAALMLVFLADARGVEDKFFENSWTERSQETLFFVLFILFVWMAKSEDSPHTLALMFAGFFLLALVRELDAVLEGNLGTGSWQLIVTLILLAMFYRLRQDWAGFKSQLLSHIESYSFGFFMAGFLTTFGFSRLLGNEELWMAIMEEGYQRNVKNAVEECVELLGDSLMFFSGIEFVIRYKRHRQIGASEAL